MHHSCRCRQHLYYCKHLTHEIGPIFQDGLWLLLAACIIYTCRTAVIVNRTVLAYCENGNHLPATLPLTVEMHVIRKCQVAVRQAAEDPMEQEVPPFLLQTQQALQIQHHNKDNAYLLMLGVPHSHCCHCVLSRLDPSRLRCMKVGCSMYMPAL